MTPNFQRKVEGLAMCTSMFCEWFRINASSLIENSLYVVPDDVLGPCKGVVEDQEVFDILISELDKIQNLWSVKDDGDFLHDVQDVQHQLDDLLIYRAILTAVMLGYATDNSEVVDNESYLRLVPIL